MDLNNFFNKINNNDNKDEKNSFIKGLESNVKNKSKSLNHYNELIVNKAKENK